MSNISKTARVADPVRSTGDKLVRRLGFVALILTSSGLSSCSTSVRMMVENQSPEDIRSFLDAGGAERVCKPILHPEDYGPRTIEVARQAVKDEGIADCAHPQRTPAVVGTAPLSMPATAAATPVTAPSSLVLADPAPVPGPPSSSVRPTVAPTHEPSGYEHPSEDILKQIQIYQNKKGCDALSYIRATSDLSLMEFSSDGEFQVQKDLAGLTLELADLAASKGCIKQARDLYMGVIKEFVGTGYAAYRERAILGIGDLKGK